MDSNRSLKIVYEEQQQELGYAKPGDAGIDLRSSEDCIIMPGSRKLVHTGIRIALPEGTVGMVCPRSGLAVKNGITIVNAPGIIDSGYTGEVCVILHNTDQNATFFVHTGDRIAQLVVVPFVSCNIEQVDIIDETERGESGFGSSGVE